MSLTCDWDALGRRLVDGERVRVKDPAMGQDVWGTVPQVTGVQSVVHLGDGRQVVMDNLALISERSIHPGRGFQPTSAGTD